MLKSDLTNGIKVELAKLLNEKLSTKEKQETFFSNAACFLTFFSDDNQDILDLAKSLAKLSNINYKQLTQNYNAILEKNNTTVNELAQKGWFLSGNIVCLAELLKILNTPKNQIEDKVFNIIKEDIDYIADEIYKLAPNRKHLISEAIIAHKNKQFALSVPVFISQADGVCHEKTGFSLFNLGRDNLSKIKKIIELQDPQLLSSKFLINSVFSFQNEFNTKLDICKNQNIRETNFSGLNRHQILHGEITDYNNEINSLKALTFLNSVCFLFMNAENSQDN